MTSSLIGFIGGGNISTCLIAGLLNNGYNPDTLSVSDHNANKREKFSQEFKVKTYDDNAQLAANCDILVLAIKPPDIKKVLETLKDIINSRRPLLISVATGIRTTQINKVLQNNLPIIRVMPNTPVLVGNGASGLYANTQVTEEQKNITESLFRAVGVTVWANHEDEIDNIAALSGAGPAYFFLIMEILEEAARHLGLPEATTQLLTEHTALGAARMALESNLNLKELRTRVTSKGGITEKALEVLESGGIRQLFKEALHAAKLSSTTISAEFDSL